MVRVVSALAVCFAAGSAFAEDVTRVFEGRWQNFKRGSSGTMRFTATSSDGKAWKGAIEGVFRREKFSYKIEFQATGRAAKKALTGKARISGDNYVWRGSMDAKSLLGEFRSQRQGFFGRFALKEVKAPPKKK